MATRGKLQVRRQQQPERPNLPEVSKFLRRVGRTFTIPPKKLKTCWAKFWLHLKPFSKKKPNKKPLLRLRLLLHQERPAEEPEVEQVAALVAVVLAVEVEVAEEAVEEILAGEAAAQE